MDWAEETTAGNKRITLFVAFNYGGRAEIVDAARGASRAAPRRSSAGHLYAPEMHDPDLLIRTSGEQRISNYLLWQCAYSELVFRDELWPDFDREAFEASLREFEERGALRDEDLMQDLFDDDMLARGAGTAGGAAPAAAAAPARDAAARPPGGSWSRSPGWSSRSRSSVAGGLVFAAGDDRRSACSACASTS